MTCVENVHFGLRHVLALAFRLSGVEREIILPPNDEQSRLLLAHPCLPLWISVHIGSIIIKQIALNLRLPRLIQKRELIRPEIRIVTIDVRIVPDMTRPRRLQRQKICAKRVFVSHAIFPKLAPRLPVCAQPFVVRDRVLNDESFYALGVRECHAKTNGPAVILHVQRVAREAERFGEMIHNLRDMIERVSEFLRVWPVAVSEARIIRRNKVKSIGKSSEERLEHSR